MCIGVFRLLLLFSSFFLLRESGIRNPARGTLAGTYSVDVMTRTGWITGLFRVTHEKNHQCSHLLEKCELENYGKAKDSERQTHKKENKLSNP